MRRQVKELALELNLSFDDIFCSDCTSTVVRETACACGNANVPTDCCCGSIHCLPYGCEMPRKFVQTACECNTHELEEKKPDQDEDHEDHQHPHHKKKHHSDQSHPTAHHPGMAMHLKSHELHENEHTKNGHHRKREHGSPSKKHHSSRHHRKHSSKLELEKGERADENGETSLDSSSRSPSSQSKIKRKQPSLTQSDSKGSPQTKDAKRDDSTIVNSSSPTKDISKTDQDDSSKSPSPKSRTDSQQGLKHARHRNRSRSKTKVSAKERVSSKSKSRPHDENGKEPSHTKIDRHEEQPCPPKCPQANDCEGSKLRCVSSKTKLEHAKENSKTHHELKDESGHRVHHKNRTRRRRHSQDSGESANSVKLKKQHHRRRAKSSVSSDGEDHHKRRSKPPVTSDIDDENRKHKKTKSLYASTSDIQQADERLKENSCMICSKRSPSQELRIAEQELQNKEILFNRSRIHCQNAFCPRPTSPHRLLYGSSHIKADIVVQTEEMTCAALVRRPVRRKIATEATQTYPCGAATTQVETQFSEQRDSSFVMLPGPIYVPRQTIKYNPPITPYCPPGLRTIQVVPAIEDYAVQRDLTRRNLGTKKITDRDSYTQTTKVKSCACPPVTTKKCTLRTCFAFSGGLKDDLLLSDDYDAGMPPSVSQFFPTISTQTTSSDFLMIDKIMEAHQEAVLQATRDESAVTDTPRARRPHSKYRGRHGESSIIVGLGSSHDNVKSNITVEQVEVIPEVASESDKKESVKKEVPLKVVTSHDENLHEDDEQAKQKKERSKVTITEALPTDEDEGEEDSESMGEEKNVEEEQQLQKSEEETPVDPEEDEASVTDNEDTIVVGISEDEEVGTELETDEVNEVEDDTDLTVKSVAIVDSGVRRHRRTSKETNVNEVMVGNDDDDDFMKKLDHKPQMSMTMSMEQRIKKVVHESELFRHPEEKRLSWTGEAGIDLTANAANAILVEPEDSVTGASGLIHNRSSINDATSNRKLEQLDSIEEENFVEDTKISFGEASER